MEDRLGILIVEDDLLQALMLEKIIGSLNHVVLGTTRFGENAIDMVVDLNPDIIFMDVGLAGAMNGIEAVQELNTITDAAIFYLTGNTWAAENEGLQNTTFEGILIKPYSLTEIQAILAKNFGSNK